MSPVVRIAVDGIFVFGEGHSCRCTFRDQSVDSRYDARDAHGPPCVILLLVCLMVHCRLVAAQTGENLSPVFCYAGHCTDDRFRRKWKGN